MRAFFLKSAFKLMSCNPPPAVENRGLEEKLRYPMTRSELIELMASRQDQLSAKDVELAVKLIIDHMAETLAAGERIEIRGFGSFSLHYREPRRGRNPKTGDTVELDGKHVPHFEPGKELRERVNRSLKTGF